MSIAVIILAAGKGTRMKSALPKVMHPVAGRPMILGVIETAETLNAEKIIAVIGPDMEHLEQVINQAGSHIECVIQHHRLGTADAVKQALPLLKGFTGDIVILYGDTPLIQPATLQKMMARLKQDDSCLTVLGFYAGDPAEYGRLIVNNGLLEEIVEFKEASASQRLINLCNSGVIAAKGKQLPELLASVTNNNSKQEYYLTDIVAIARLAGHRCAYVEGDEQEVLGINSRSQLAEAEAIMQTRLRSQAMDNGVTLIAPETVTFCHDTVIANDVVVHPQVVFGPKVTIHSGAEIKSFSHIEGAVIEEAAIVGPFARLRPGSVIGKHAHVGNFVEIKNTQLAEGAKANHLSYIGDSSVGKASNIGAGTITCNYDGFTKSRTVIGDEVFIGSHSTLIAPVTIGNGTIIAAGSVITEDVGADSLAISRVDQKNIAGKAVDIRKKKAKSSPPSLL